MENEEVVVVIMSKIKLNETVHYTLSLFVLLKVRYITFLEFKYQHFSNPVFIDGMHFSASLEHE